jgi:hypothetical protein
MEGYKLNGPHSPPLDREFVCISKLLNGTSRKIVSGCGTKRRLGSEIPQALEFGSRKHS